MSATSAIAGLVRDLRQSGSGNLLRDLRLRGIDPRTQLRGCDLSETDMHGLDLRGFDLSDANLKWVDFDGAKLMEASFADSHLAQARLERADLTGADFRGATLRQTNLRRAIFEGADLTGAALAEWCPLGADFTDAVLDPPAAAAARIIANPDRLLSDWDPPPPDDPNEPPPPPLSAETIELLMDGLLQCVYQAALARCAGVDPSSYAPDRFRDPYALYLTHTQLEIGAALNDARGELLVQRRNATKAGREQALAQSEYHLGVIATLNREFEEAGQYLDLAMTKYRGFRDGVRVATLNSLLGLLALEQLDHLNAVRGIRKAVEMFESGGRADGVLRHSLCLSILAIQHGQFERAAQFTAKAASMTAEPGPDLTAVAQTAVGGALAWRMGAAPEARMAWRRSGDLLLEQGHKRCAIIFDKLIEGVDRLSPRPNPEAVGPTADDDLVTS